VNSDASKDLFSSLDLKYSKSADNISQMRGFDSRITWLPGKHVRLNVGASYSYLINNQQYISTITAGSTNYLTGLLNRKIFEIVFRGDVYITPELSVRYYGSPYYSTGKYYDFKTVANGASHAIAGRFDLLKTEYDSGRDIYIYGTGNGMSFENPDFEFLEFRSNFVFRWEYKLGSTVYFVWSNSKTVWQDWTRKSTVTADLFRYPGDNIFMVKFNYWFAL
jgi:hypothetical protein